MTTGTLSDNKVAFVRNDWTYYDYSQKTWSGGDTPPSQRPKDKVFKKYSYYVTEIVNGHKVPKLVEVTRSRSVPRRSTRLPPHDYTMSFKEMKQDWFSFRWSNGTNYGEGALINELPFTAAWTSDDDIKLLDKLRDSIAGSSFNAGVSLGESGKTLSMIGDHAKRLRLFYTNFRKGNFARASDELFVGRAKLKKPSKAAASNFLAVKYGWLPLLNDVNEGAKFLAHTFNSPRIQRYVVTRSLGKRGDSSYDHPYWGLNGGSTIMANMSRLESKKIVASVSEVNVAQLSGLQDPLSIAWELVPYSFVIDWFIPIGSWLSARGLSQSLTATYVTTYFHREKLNYLWLNTPGTWGYSLDRRMDRGSWKRVYMSRSVTSSLPVPPRPVVRPLADSSTWGRALTSVALLINLKR